MIEAITKKYLAFAIEPIHIGSRSDEVSRGFASCTARDVNGFPFVPASSLKGCVRALCSPDFGVQSCDGKGWNCPQPHKCPSCSVFGFSNYHHRGSQSSLVRFSSMDLLAIPIRTENGVVWITSWFRLTRSGLIASTPTVTDNWAVAENLKNDVVESLLEMVPSYDPELHPITGLDTEDWPGPSEAKDVYKNIAVLNENALFSLVNYFTSSMTSVSIDPQSGQARSGALFEIEHINRWSLLAFEVTFMNPVSRGINEFVNTKNPHMPTISATIDKLIWVVESGLEKIRYYGIGGKRSRGYGRVNVWEIPIEHENLVLEKRLPLPILDQVPKIMISYSHKNAKDARRLATDLQEEKFNVWLDEKEVLIGDSIHTKVEEGVTDCDYLIVLFSPDSIVSSWVKEEMNAARSREKESHRVILLPVALAGVNTLELPTLIKDRKFAEISPKYETGFQEIVKSIRQHEARRK